MIVPTRLEILAVPGMPEVTEGTDLAAAIATALDQAAIAPRHGDVLVVAQKVVSKAEGAVVRLADVKPSDRAAAWAQTHGKDAAAVEVVLREANRIVRMERGVVIAETRHGFICANAGVDASNVSPGQVTLLPHDPDRSAARLCRDLSERFRCPLAIVIADTFGRPWREGAVNVAVGVAGLRPLDDWRGRPDAFGRRLQSTVIAVADEIAGAAELVMGKTAGTPVALVRGADEWIGEGTAAALVRPASMDLFR